MLPEVTPAQRRGVEKRGNEGGKGPFTVETGPNEVVLMNCLLGRSRPCGHPPDLVRVCMAFNEEQVALPQSSALNLPVGRPEGLDLSKTEMPPMDIRHSKIGHLSRKADSLARDLQSPLHLRDFAQRNLSNQCAP